MSHRLRPRRLQAGPPATAPSTPHRCGPSSAVRMTPSPPVIALTPALIYFQPTNLPAAAATTVFYVVFAVTLIGRPIGSFIFGHLGDKIGRRKTTMIAVTGFGLVTLLIAILPGYQAIGIAALVLLILLRLIDGVFLGGEYTAASPLAMEFCRKPKRGFYSTVIQAGYQIAYVAIFVLVKVMLIVACVNCCFMCLYVRLR